MKSHFLFASFFALSIALTASPARAQSYSVTATCSAGGGNGDSHTDPTSASASAAYHYYNPIDPTYPEVIDSTVSAAGQQGLLTGAVLSSTQEDTSNVAAAKANWADSLTVASSSLTVGTPVQLVFFASYQASIYVNVYNPIFTSVAGAETSLDFEDRATDAATGNMIPLVFTQTDAVSTVGNTQHNYDMTLQGTLDTTVGATINLSSLVDMEAGGGVSFGGFKIHTDADINSFSSALSVNTPADVSVISASGHNYAMTTPAPASLPIFAGGISVMLFALRRRRTYAGNWKLPV